MDFWQRARSFADEAAKRSKELTKEAAKRSQDLTIGSSKLSDIVSEASKRSQEIAAEASKRADQIKAEAFKRADQIKSQIPHAAVLSSLVEVSPVTTTSAAVAEAEAEDLKKFGVTDELREFVKGITVNTFRDFPLGDDSEMPDIPTISNVRQDLTAWQEIHANLVLSKVKEISKLRYELCPRMMKERKFWRIYFILVNSHVALYEKQYMEEAKLKSAEQVKDDDKMKDTSRGGAICKTEAGVVMNQKTKASSSSEQDLDIFLLGDLGDIDEGPDDGDGDFDDDFDKI